MMVNERTYKAEDDEDNFLSQEMIKIEKEVEDTLGTSEYVAEIIYHNNTSYNTIFKLTLGEDKNNPHPSQCILKSQLIEKENIFRVEIVRRENYINTILSFVCKYFLGIYSSHIYTISQKYDKCQTITEYGGENLEEICESLTMRDFGAIGFQLLDAMNVLEKIGVAHLDLKLVNILYTPETREIKLIDFGISKAYFLNFKRIKQLIGKYDEGITGFTQFYAAPEMLFRNSKMAHIPNKVDVFCFGITLLYLLFQIQKEKWSVMRNGTLENHLHFLKFVNYFFEKYSINRILAKLFFKCLQYDPKKRPSFKSLHKRFLWIFEKYSENLKPVKLNFKELALTFRFARLDEIAIPCFIRYLKYTHLNRLEIFMFILYLSEEFQRILNKELSTRLLLKATQFSNSHKSELGIIKYIMYPQKIVLNIPVSKKEEGKYFQIYSVMKQGLVNTLFALLTEAIESQNQKLFYRYEKKLVCLGPQYTISEEYYFNFINYFSYKYECIGDFEKAIQLCREAEKKIYNRPLLENLDLQYTIQCIKGRIYSSSNNDIGLRETLENMLRLQFYTGSDSTMQYVFLLITLGITYNDLDEYQKAEEIFGKAHTIMKHLEFDKSVVKLELYYRLGSLFYEIEKIFLAIKYLEKAKKFVYEKYQHIFEIYITLYLISEMEYC